MLLNFLNTFFFIGSNYVFSNQEDVEKPWHNWQVHQGTYDSLPLDVSHSQLNFSQAERSFETHVLYIHVHNIFINVNPQRALLFILNIYFNILWQVGLINTNTWYHMGSVLFIIYLANNSNKAMANITSLNHEIKYDVSLLCKCHLMLKLWIAPCSYGELQKKLNVKLDCALRLWTHTTAFTSQIAVRWHMQSN